METELCPFYGIDCEYIPVAQKVSAYDDEVKRLREVLLQIKQRSMETHIRAMAHQALHPNEAQILATNIYEAEGRN